MKLGIGTAQFGLNYGVSNQLGMTPQNEVQAILDFAIQQNINLLDTAALYGSSESVIGQALSMQHNFAIVTKTIKFTESNLVKEHATALTNSFRKSLEKLGQQSIYGLLMHDANDLLLKGGEYLFDALLSFKQQGLVKKIGVSVYKQSQIEAILARYNIDLLQFPINVFDQSLLQDNFLVELKKKNIELHARSVFLQGLLLMDADKLPPYFDAIKPQYLHYRQMLKNKKLSPVAAALGFVLGIEAIDKVVCGVNNLEQLQELHQSAQPLATDDFIEFALNDECFINPSRWQL